MRGNIDLHQATENVAPPQLIQNGSERGRIAGQEMAAANQELAETRLAVVADVRRAYWSYYYATTALDITRRNRTILDQFKDVATAKFRSGTATQQGQPSTVKLWRVKVFHVSVLVGCQSMAGCVRTAAFASAADACGRSAVNERPQSAAVKSWRVLFMA